jgi:hypothetical protein
MQIQTSFPPNRRELARSGDPFKRAGSLSSSGRVCSGCPACLSPVEMGQQVIAEAVRTQLFNKTYDSRPRNNTHLRCIAMSFKAAIFTSCDSIKYTTIWRKLDASHVTIYRRAFRKDCDGFSIAARRQHHDRSFEENGHAGEGAVTTSSDSDDFTASRQKRCCCRIGITYN